MSQKIKILYLGSHLQSFRCFQYLINECDGAEVVGMMPHQVQPPVRDDQDIRQIASENKIPILEFDELKNQKFDLGISLLWDKKVPEDILSIPTRGFVNFHLGPLPRFRGSYSILNAIRLAREDNHWKFGVTLHYMDATVDTGPLIEVMEMPIYEDDTAFDLYNRSCEKVYDLFVRYIHALLESKDRLPSKPQEGKSYSFKRKDLPKHEVQLDWSSEKIYDTVRALSFPGKPKPYIVIGKYRYYLSLEDK